MKKIFGAMMVATALFAWYNTYNTQHNTELTGVALANVEALANGSDDETKSGRYRTVGCGSMAFRDWDQYC